jgi:hypothetical protein
VLHDLFIGGNKLFIGLNNSFIGVNKLFIGLNNSFIGVNKLFIGLNNSFIGANKLFIGLNNSFIGLNNPCGGKLTKLVKKSSGNQMKNSGLRGQLERRVRKKGRIRGRIKKGKFRMV